MSIYRLNTARLLVATYGEKFDPDTAQPLHIQAQLLEQDLPGKPDFQAVFDDVVKTWRSSDVATPALAMTQACEALAAALVKQFPTHTFELVTAENFYVPIYDKSGKVVGHDSVAWLYEDDDSVVVEEKGDSDELETGMIACVFVSVGAA